MQNKFRICMFSLLFASASALGFFKPADWLRTKTQKVVVFDVNGVILDFNGKLIPQSALLLQRCAQAGHQIMILSNGSESMIGHLFMSYYNQIVRYIQPQHIFISGKTNHSKPQARAYLQIVELVNKELGSNVEIFFIDDSYDNVQAANANGLYGLHLKNNDYAKLEIQLKLLGVLPLT